MVVVYQVMQLVEVAVVLVDIYQVTQLLLLEQRTQLLSVREVHQLQTALILRLAQLLRLLAAALEEQVL